MENTRTESSELTCDVCGVQDGTLRLSIFLLVWSAVLFSRRSAKAGILCARHRSIEALKWSALSLLVGPWGVPWGIIWTGQALITNARGGQQPSDLNAQLLRSAAVQAIEQGRASDAAVSLASSIKFEHNDEAAQLLASIIYQHPQIAEAAADAEGKLSAVSPIFLIGAGLAASPAIGVIALVVLLFGSGGSAVDPYFDNVADRQEELVSKSDTLLDEFNSSLDACTRSVLSTTACDRAFTTLDTWGQTIAETRQGMIALEPPPDARAWHQDYLAYLRDASAWADRMVSAYSRSNGNALETAFSEMDGLIQREDELGSEFEEIQRQLGAR